MPAPAPVPVVGNVLVDLISTVANEIGPSVTFAATSDAPAVSTQVISWQLMDQEAPPEKWGGHYLYCVQAAPPPAVDSLLAWQGRVRKGGFAGATGTLTAVGNWPHGAKNTSRWIMIGMMPVVDADGLVGMVTCINRAVRRIWVPLDYPLVAVEGQTQYDLGALWFASRPRFTGLLDPIPAGSTAPAAQSSQAWDVVQNGEIWTLQLGSGYPAGQTFWLQMDAPGNFRLKRAGVWTNFASPVSALSQATDACLGNPSHVVLCSAYECAKQLSIQAGGNRKSYWVGRAAELRAVVSAIKTYVMDDGRDDTLGGGKSLNPGSSGWPKGLFAGV